MKKIFKGDEHDYGLVDKIEEWLHEKTDDVYRPIITIEIFRNNGDPLEEVK